jgi:hypothetical protein
LKWKFRLKNTERISKKLNRVKLGILSHTDEINGSSTISEYENKRHHFRNTAFFLEYGYIR